MPDLDAINSQIAILQRELEKWRILLTTGNSVEKIQARKYASETRRALNAAKNKRQYWNRIKPN